MFRVYVAVFLLALICVLISWEVNRQPTTDDDTENCGSSLLYSSEQVANLIQKAVERIMASNQQQRVSPSESKLSLVSALVCEYISRIINCS